MMESIHEGFFISRLMLWECIRAGGLEEIFIRDLFMKGVDVHRGFIVGEVLSRG